MTWLRRVQSTGPEQRRRWSYSFRISKDHPSLERLRSLQFSFDRIGTEAYERLLQLQSQASLGNENDVSIDSSLPNRADCLQPDLFQILRHNSRNDDSLYKLWTQVHETPEWVDWEQISRGQEVFYRYGGPILIGLLLQSLLAGMGSRRVAETLIRTGGFSARTARKRLFETTQFLLQCTRSVEDLRPGGQGWVACIRVRLLHAAVRSRILRLANQRPAYFDAASLGVPINDLDSISTIAAFSATIIWITLPRQGIFLRQQEKTDFLALFRYIAHVSGTPTDFFSSLTKAKAVMEVILFHDIDPSDNSKKLANNVLDGLSNQPPQYASRAFLEASARWLNGDDLCDALGLGRPHMLYSILVMAQCSFFVLLCYGYRSLPFLDRRKIKTLRRVFWHVFVDGKHGLGMPTTFQFQFIPSFDVPKADMNKIVGRNISMREVEQRIMRILALFVILFGILLPFLVVLSCWKQLSQ